MESWLQNNNIKIYSIHNEEKSGVAERSLKFWTTKFISIWNQY